MEVAVVIGTHGGIRARPHDTHEALHNEFDFLFPVTWPDNVNVEVCGITMPFGGNVNYADDTRETRAVHAATHYLEMSRTFFDNNNLKLRRLADALLDSDKYLPDACVHGSQNQFSDPKIHLGATLESDFDNEVSDTMEGVTGFDVVKGCALPNGKLDKRQIIANYVPVVYSNTGIVQPPAGNGPTKVPLCSKVFTLNTEEYDQGRGHDSDPKKRPKAEWKVTLLIKNPDGTVTTNDQFVEQLLHVSPSSGIFGSEGAAKPHLRPDEHSKAFYTETLISYLIESIGATKITILDVTCNVLRNSGPQRPGGFSFGDVCEHGITPATKKMLHRTVTPWIMLSQFGILENYDNPHPIHAEGDGYYHDRFRNATHSAVYALIIKYYEYLQLIYDCKEAVLRQVEIDATTQEHTLKVALKTKTPNTKLHYIQAFFDRYKAACLAKRVTAIEKPPKPSSKASKGGKSHKTRQGLRNKSRNFRNKSRSRSKSRRTRRRVIKRKK